MSYAADKQTDRQTNKQLDGLENSRCGIISIVVIQVTKSNFPTTATSKKVSPNDSNNERQQEIAIWPPKPEILITLEL